MNRDDLAALLHVLAWLAVIAVSLLAKTDFLVSIRMLKPLGMATFLLGMSLFAWGVVHLKGAFLGNVEPISDVLVTTGPYRFVRHPVYLGMVIPTLGLALGLRSLWGVIGVFLVFVPVSAYRAKLEEKAMARRFGQEWTDYATRTHFMFPLIY